MFLSKSEIIDIDVFGVELDVVYRGYNFYSSLELSCFQDPNEGIIQMQQKKGKIFASGIKLTSALCFDIDNRIIKKIEPLILIGYYTPDIKKIKSRTSQLVIGTDLYFSKKVKFRINGDLLLTKNEYNFDFSTYDSRVTAEIFIIL